MGRPNLGTAANATDVINIASSVNEPTRTIMLDNPEKTSELIAELKAALPFEVELTPEVIESLRMGKSKLVSSHCKLSLMYPTSATKEASCVILFQGKRRETQSSFLLLTFGCIVSNYLPNQFSTTRITG